MITAQASAGQVAIFLCLALAIGVVLATALRRMGLWLQLTCSSVALGVLAWLALNP